MRFDTPIYFRLVESTYNEDTGNYDDTVTEEKRYASISDTGSDTLRLIYGELKQGSKTVRLLSPYNKPFSNVRIGDKIYTVDRSRLLRTKQTLIVSEVQ